MEQSIMMLLRKYAIVVIVFVFLEITVGTGLRVVALPFLYSMFNTEDAHWYQLYLPTAITIALFIFNIISAILIYSDLKKLEIRVGPLVMLTLISYKVGLCFSMIAILYHRFKKFVPDL